MSTLWIGKAHASQGDVVRLLKRAMRSERIVASHEDDREDILGDADIQLREPKDAEGSSTEEAADAYYQWLLLTNAAQGASAILCSRHRARLIEHADSFARQGARLYAGATTREALLLADDKMAFTERMDGIVPVARSIRFDTVDQLISARGQFDHDADLCVKPIWGVYGRGFMRLVPDADLYKLLSGRLDRAISLATYIEAMSRGAPEPMVLMEYLPGPEYSVDMVCDAGRVIAAVSRMKFEHYQIIETRGPQIEIARAVAEELLLDGIVNVQTRGDASGGQCVLEANTRISGGVSYGAGAGLNLPAVWGRHALGYKTYFSHLDEPVAVRISLAPYELRQTTAALARESAA